MGVGGQNPGNHSVQIQLKGQSSYQFGISLDTHNRLSLTPLNISLGIYNIESRKRAGAWECIYFHPDSPLEALNQKVKLAW